MKNLIATTAILAMLTGCAAKHQDWDLNGRTEAQFQADCKQCEAQAYATDSKDDVKTGEGSGNLAISSAVSSGLAGGLVGGVAGVVLTGGMEAATKGRNNNRYNNCLRKLGYTVKK